MSNILDVTFGSERYAKTAPLWQYDYGQILRINGIDDLPGTFEVQFSNCGVCGVTKTQIGQDNEVVIPDIYLRSGKGIRAYIYLHAGENDGETVYTITIPVLARPYPADGTPTPVQQELFQQMLVALAAGTKRAEDAAEEIENLSVEAETLPAGSTATADYENGTLTLGLPEGAKGDDGSGVWISSDPPFENTTESDTDWSFPLTYLSGRAGATVQAGDLIFYGAYYYPVNWADTYVAIASERLSIRGAIGPAGPGLPAGGTDGQIIRKVGSEDYVTEWSEEEDASVLLIHVADAAPRLSMRAQALRSGSVTLQSTDDEFQEVEPVEDDPEDPGGEFYEDPNQTVEEDPTRVIRLEDVVGGLVVYLEGKESAFTVDGTRVNTVDLARRTASDYTDEAEALLGSGALPLLAVQLTAYDEEFNVMPLSGPVRIRIEHADLASVDAPCVLRVPRSGDDAILAASGGTDTITGSPMAAFATDTLGTFAVLEATSMSDYTGMTADHTAAEVAAALAAGRPVAAEYKGLYYYPEAIRGDLLVLHADNGPDALQLRLIPPESAGGAAYGQVTEYEAVDGRLLFRLNAEDTQTAGEVAVDPAVCGSLDLIQAWQAGKLTVCAYAGTYLYPVALEIVTDTVTGEAQSYRFTFTGPDLQTALASWRLVLTADARTNAQITGTAAQEISEKPVFEVRARNAQTAGEVYVDTTKCTSRELIEAYEAGRVLRCGYGEALLPLANVIMEEPENPGDPYTRYSFGFSGPEAWPGQLGEMQHIEIWLEADAATDAAITGEVQKVTWATTDELAEKYTLPSGGIPKTDLASAVQTSLGKADTALQSVPSTYRTAAAQDAIDATKYVKPSGGIPKTDLASAVQTSLNKADTALQSVPSTYRTAAAQDAIDATKYVKPSGGIPKTDLASAVQTSLGKADTALQSVPSTYRTAAAQDTIDSGKIDKPSNPATGAFLVWNGSAWAAQTLATWQGGTY